jgi:hypothetical protein
MSWKPLRTLSSADRSYLLPSSRTCYLSSYLESQILAGDLSQSIQYFGHNVGVIIYWFGFGRPLLRACRAFSFFHFGLRVPGRVSAGFSKQENQKKIFL